MGIEKELEDYLINNDSENFDLLSPTPGRQDHLKENQTTITPSITTEPNPFSPLVEIIRIFYRVGNIDFSQLINPSMTISPSPSLTFISPTTSYPTLSIFNPPISSYSNFTQLFEEVGSKVGVPPKILAAVTTAESPSTLNLTKEKINLYSTPNNVIPNCRPNVCSATGPMQMTIGVDNSGSFQCLKCGLTYCPNAWARYGKSINIFKGASHNPNLCNLLDNIYATAYKLKNDSEATDPINCSQEQVYRAGTRYHGSCSDRYRYPRLGNRTYCEFLWWFYTNN